MYQHYGGTSASHLTYAMNDENDTDLGIVVA